MLLEFLADFFWIPLVVAVVVLVIFKYRRQQERPLPGIEQDESSRSETPLERSRQVLQRVRTALDAHKDRKLTEYLTLFTDPLNELTERVLGILERSVILRGSTIVAVLRVCNHRMHILTAKRQLKEIADLVEKDFIALDRRMSLGLMSNSSEENMKHIVLPLLPSLKAFELVYESMPSVEKRLMSQVDDVDGLVNPGFARKVGHFFSKKKKRADQKRLNDLKRDWNRLAGLWNQLYRLNSVVTKDLKKRLDDYLTKLIVFTPYENLVAGIIKREKPLSAKVVDKVAGSA